MKARWLVVLLAVFFVFSLAFAGDVGPANGKPDPSSRKLVKYTFIHYRKEPSKPEWAKGGGGKTDGEYKFIANGFKWKTQEPFVVNPSNPSGLSASFVYSATNAGFTEWEKYGGDIFGPLSVDYTAYYDDTTIDGLNTLSFGYYGDPRVIAVTSVWGYYSTNPKWREIVEVDILFNVAYAWGNGTIDSTVMDLQNIATHEIGHDAGMDDLYTLTATEETMYGYSTEGEIKKRDLYKGDIAGIQKLYQ